MPDALVFIKQFQKTFPAIRHFSTSVKICGGSDIIEMANPATCAMLKEMYIRSLLALDLVLKPWQRKDSSLIIGEVKQFLTPWKSFYIAHWYQWSIFTEILIPNRALHADDEDDESNDDGHGDDGRDQGMHQLEGPSGLTDVVEDIVHEEPAVLPDPSDVIVANELWARGVEHLIHQGLANPEHDPEATPCAGAGVFAALQQIS
mmetsp:Transcript_29393/g.51522  ORF Transcript_29393/g.51522 Transcript_29393/m.51522 type:complete len:204 (-) Transcript_29393:598-1209(-)